MGDSVGYGERLTGSRTGDDNQGARSVVDRFTLLIIEDGFFVVSRLFFFFFFLLFYEMAAALLIYFVLTCPGFV